MAQKGQFDQGIEQLQQGLASYRATGARILVPYYSAYLTEALLAAGRPEEALPMVAQAIALSQSNLDSFYEPELQRLRGEVLWRLDTDSPMVEGCFRDVLALARAQGAKSLELRAATSLGRLLAAQGRREEATLAVEGIFGWFTEGLDTRDLRNARALLDQLSRIEPIGIEVEQDRSPGPSGCT
jgi:predicted ATPase